MNGEVKLFTDITATLTRDSIDNSRRPFLVPEMLFKLKTGFQKRVLPLRKVNSDFKEEEITIPNPDLEFTMTEIPVLKEEPEVKKSEKEFRKFKNAEVLDSYGLLDKMIRTMSLGRRLAISPIFKEKLVQHTNPKVKDSIDLSEIISEIKALILKRDETVGKIDELSVLVKGIDERVTSLKTNYKITDDILGKVV